MTSYRRDAAQKAVLADSRRTQWDSVEVLCCGYWEFRFRSFCCWRCSGTTDRFISQYAAPQAVAGANIVSNRKRGGITTTTRHKEQFMDQVKTQGSSKAAAFPDGPGGSIANSMSRGKEAVSAATSEAIDSGGADLKALQNDLSDLKDTVTKFIARASNETAKSAREIAGQVGTAASDIAQRGANAASVATDQAKTFATELENIARRNPLGAIAGAVVVGVLFGMMGRRS
jgi:ElaB/YqjD/DUF883 family membrane-anchored ribosome-binding protein